MEDKTIKNDEKPWLFKEGNPGGGRPKDTPEDKLRKKVEKDFIAEYKKNLEAALPLISPVLIAKAIEGDIQAIKEINDRVMGKPNQTNEHIGEIKLTLDFNEQGYKPKISTTELPDRDVDGGQEI